MKKVILIIIFIMIIISGGCSNKEVIKHNYTYIGENENWTAEYKVNGTGTFTKKDGKTYYGSNSKSTLSITYKKDISVLSSVNHLEISYESSAGGGKLTRNADDGDPINQKTFTLSSASSGGAIENKDEIIKVIISLDGKAESIELKNKL